MGALGVTVLEREQGGSEMGESKLPKVPGVSLVSLVSGSRGEVAGGEYGRAVEDDTG